MDDSLQRKLALDRAAQAHREELRRAMSELVHVAQDRIGFGINVARHAWAFIFGALILGLRMGLRKPPREVR